MRWLYSSSFKSAKSSLENSNFCIPLSISFFLLVFSPLNGAVNLKKMGDFGSYAVPIASIAWCCIEEDFSKVLGLGGVLGGVYGTTTLLKEWVGEPRPGQIEKGKSFPSRHTSMAFAGAAFLHAHYGFFAAVPSYLVASFVGFTRLHEKKHHIHDIFAGALLGIGLAHQLFPWKEKLYVVPIFLHNGGSLKLGCNF